MTETPQTEIVDERGDRREIVALKYEITSYGADFLIDGLVRRLSDGAIFIPVFQRDFVWNHRQASRFIESLLLGLPVPGIFLSKDFDTQKLLVIDGQQRLKTLQYFYEGQFADTGRVFELRGVQPQFDRLTYKTLRPEDKRRLDDSVLHATIVQQETPPEDDSSIYYIFERINTSGTPLSPQEIRACIYHGLFNELLRKLNSHEDWRSVFGRVDKRMRDQELILRFFALYFEGDSYKKPMREFLNQYMASNRKLHRQQGPVLERLFSNTVEVINRYLGGQAFRPTRALNAAVFDAVMVGVAQRLQRGPIEDEQAFRRCYQSLMENAEFLEVTTKSTADEVSVRRRIGMAVNAFSDVS